MSRSLVSKSHLYKRSAIVSALVSEESAVTSSSSDDTDGFKLTYLEVDFHILIGLSRI